MRAFGDGGQRIFMEVLNPSKALSDSNTVLEKYLKLILSNSIYFKFGEDNVS